MLKDGTFFHGDAGIGKITMFFTLVTGRVQIRFHMSKCCSTLRLSDVGVALWCFVNKRDKTHNYKSLWYDSDQYISLCLYIQRQVLSSTPTLSPL